MPDKFAFVATDARGKARKSDSVLIRSHCMRGKNARDTSRRSKRRVKRTALRPSGSESEPEPQQPSLLRHPSDIDLFHFAGKVDDCTKQILFRFLDYSRCSNLLYPIEHLLVIHRIADYVEWLSRDVAFFHSMLLSTSAMNDFALQRPLSALTCLHLRNTLCHLNSALSKPDPDNLDSTVFVVLTLAIVATMFQDFGATSTHIQGLQQIVKLHGGHRYLRQYPKMHFKIERLDLSWCLVTGRKPLFFTAPVTWVPFFSGSLPTPSHLYEILSIDGIAWPKLAVAYNDLRYLANLINETEASNAQISVDLFQGAVHSIQSRLLDLQDRLGDELAECLRLGMLAFLTTTFRMPGRKMPYPYLASRLRKMLQDPRPTTLAAQHVLFWALMMSVVAVFELDEPWILDTWKAIAEEGNSWEEARQRLQALIWIPFLHDEPARTAFLQLQCRK